LRDCYWHCSLSPSPKIRAHTRLDASNNATSGYLGAGYAFGKGLYESDWLVCAVGSLHPTTIRGLCSARAPISALPLTARRAMVPHSSAANSGGKLSS